MKNFDTPGHTRGSSPFIDDLPELPGTLHGVAVPSPVAHGILRDLDLSAALVTDGVVRVLTAGNVPGENQIGGIIPDEPLLAEGEVHFVGQPVALVVADSPLAARRAAKKVRVDVEELPPLFDPREAAARGMFIAPPRRLVLGDPDLAWPGCEVVVEGRADTGGQEHLYLEMQGAVAVPEARGRMVVHSSTQAPTAVQRAVAGVLGWAMNRVEVNVPRLGGAFGGKEDQANAWAALAALAAAELDRPVKVVLQRHEDLRMTGKRHPYSADFKIGLSRDLRIQAYEVTLYQNSGAAADLSTAVLERSLFHATNSYYIPHVRVTGMCCRTHLPPFTAFRGFGGPQAMFVMEAAIARAAEALGVPAWRIQDRNLLRDQDELPCGMRVHQSQARRSFDEVRERFNFEGVRSDIDRFNAEHRRQKQGLSLMPVCFGISFTNTMLNQAGALVHVYTDGSASVSTGAVEMGQGVNTKILRIVARTLGLDEGCVHMEHTNTTRVANTSPTAASSGADLNGMAALLAAQTLRERLQAVAGELLGVSAASVEMCHGQVLAEGASRELSWAGLVETAYQRRINLSAQALYATPHLQYDKQQEKGTPFAYHVFGTAMTRVTVDCLRGTYTVDAVQAVHDAGRSLDPLIDRGQAEGGIVQGIGWMTMEDLVYDAAGHLRSNALSTYKVPDLHAVPGMLEVAFLEDADNPRAVMRSKAIGEPPFMYGIGTYFALLQALQAFRPDRPAFFEAPMTPERVFRFLHDPSGTDG